MSRGFGIGRRKAIAACWIAGAIISFACDGAWNNEAEQGGAWAETEPWTLSEDGRIGDPHNGDTLLIGRIGPIGVNAAGSIYVGDALDARVMVFGADGMPSDTIGRRGQGPGEFVRVGNIDFRGDTVWIMDPVGARYSAFDAEGVLVSTVTRTLGGWYESEPGRFVPGVGYLDWKYGRMRDSDGKDLYSFAPVLLTDAMEPLAEFPPVEFPMLFTEDGRPQAYYTPYSWIHVDERGNVWVARGDEYRITKRTLSGDTLLNLSLPVRPATISAAEREAIRPPYRNSLPEAKPVTYGILGDGDGHVFVIPGTADVEPGEALDVFTDAGSYLGRLELPCRAVIRPPKRTIIATPSHVYVVCETPEGHEYISRSAILR